MSRTKDAQNWPPEREDALRRLWVDEGLSSGECARQLGLSRNSIIGKVVRMKLPRHSDYHVRQSVRPTDRRLSGGSSMIQRVRKMKMMPTSLPGDTRRLSGDAWSALPDTNPVPLVGLDPGMCKWPIGEGKPYLFCGAEAADGSYCVHHTRTARGAGTPSERVAHVAREARPC